MAIEFDDHLLRDLFADEVSSDRAELLTPYEPVSTSLCADVRLGPVRAG